MSAKKNSVNRLVAYSLPSLTISGIMGYPLIALIPPLYARHADIDLSVIGTILFMSRIFDGVTDPLIGVLSDRTKSRLGRRKPWMLLGALLMVISVYFLFMPKPGVGAVYFAASMFALYLSWTMVEIPYKAWASELSRDYHERSRITTYLAIFGALGGIVFLAAPLVPYVDIGADGLGGLKAMAWIFIALTLPFVLIAVLTVPPGKNIAASSTQIITDVRSMLGNRLFLRFLLIYCVYGAGVGVNGAVLFFFIDYLDLGSPTAGIAGLLIVFSAALLGMPIWLRVIQRIGKHRSWALAAVLNAFIMPWAFLIEPGQGATLPALVCGILLGLVAGPYNIVPLAMLSDIVDYDILKSGVNRAGNYISIQHLLAKVNAAFGASGAFFMLDAFGFKAGGGSDETGILGLKIVGLLLPTVFFVIAALLVFRFPLDERRHAIIRKRVEGRAKRRSSIDPAASAGIARP